MWRPWGSQVRKYQTLDGLYRERDAVAWYWRSQAFAASWIILAGYIVLPGTFLKDSDNLRIGRSTLSVLGVALLTTGYCLTALLAFACPSVVFQAEAIYSPSLASSTLGLLTTVWPFITTSNTAWTSTAYISLILSIAGSLIYTLLLILTTRHITFIRTRSRHTSYSSITPLTTTHPPSLSTPSAPSSFYPPYSPQPTPTYPLAPTSTTPTPRTLTTDNPFSPPLPSPTVKSTTPKSSPKDRWQHPAFYANFIANMYPSALRAKKPAHPAEPSEEEMTRQQMLMLLLKGDEEGSGGGGGGGAGVGNGGEGAGGGGGREMRRSAAEGTYRIEWETGDEEGTLGRGRTGEDPFGDVHAADRGRQLSIVQTPLGMTGGSFRSSFNARREGERERERDGLSGSESTSGVSLMTPRSGSGNGTGGLLVPGQVMEYYGETGSYESGERSGSGDRGRQQVDYFAADRARSREERERRRLEIEMGR